MKADIEKYIGGLDPELQGKARQCKTKEELSAFIADNDLELPEDALELVSGGCGTPTPPKNAYCKYCGNAVITFCGNKGTTYRCDSNHCGKTLSESEIVWR